MQHLKPERLISLISFMLSGLHASLSFFHTKQKQRKEFEVGGHKGRLYYSSSSGTRLRYRLSHNISNYKRKLGGLKSFGLNSSLVVMGRVLSSRGTKCGDQHFSSYNVIVSRINRQKIAIILDTTHFRPVCSCFDEENTTSKQRVIAVQFSYQPEIMHFSLIDASKLPSQIVFC